MERIDILKAKLEELTINEPYPQFRIEPEIIAYAMYVTKKVVSRTIQKENINARTLGVLGQELFNGCLLQYKIPNVYANPIYKDKTMRQINKKHFDFIVPHMPKEKQIISIKTISEREKDTRFVATIEEWENEIHDIAIAIKIDSLTQHKAHMAGWLFAKEIEKLPTYDFGWGMVYYTYLDPTDAQKCEIPPLHNIIPLMEQLLKGSYTLT